MGSRTYSCYIVSNDSYERIYTVTSRSALKAAEKYGRCESGETVTIRTHMGQILSKAAWDQQNRKYINVSF